MKRILSAAAVVFVSFLFVRPAGADEGLVFSGPIPLKPVRSVSFTGWDALGENDLRSTLLVHPGEVLNQSALEKSVEKLYQRGIFESIDVELASDEAGVDVKFQLVPALLLFEVRFSGSSTMDETTLRRLAGLRLGERLDMNQLLEARRRIEQGYQRLGYFTPTVKAAIAERSVPPQIAVEFTIAEGYLSKIAKIALEGTLPADVEKLRTKLERRGIGAPATNENIRNLRREFLSALRKEGYLEASVEFENVTYNQLSGDVEVSGSVQAREPLSLIFQGNKEFSPEELLEPLKMETRTVPFTPSAIRTLCIEIEAIYEQNGYFFAHAEYKEIPAAGGRRNYLLQITEGKKVRLRNIKFEGNEHISSSELRRIMQTRPAGFLLFRRWNPGYLQKEQISSDLAAIEELYRQRGYEGVKTSFELTPAGSSDRLDLKIVVEEGVLGTIQSVRTVWKGISLAGDKGDPQSNAALVATPLQIQAGDPLSPAAIRAEQDRLTGVIIREGYPNVRVETETDSSDNSIKFIIEPGTQITVGQIAVAGNAFTKDHLIRRELTLRSGHVFRPEDLQNSEQGLYRTGFFRTVEIQPTDGVFSDPVEDFTVKVSERDTGLLQLGGAINTEDGLHIFSELGQRNLNGQGESLVMGVDGYIQTGTRLLDAGNARLRFTQPHIFGSEMELASEAFSQYSIQLIDPYSYDRAGVSSTVRISPFQLLQGSLGISAYSEVLYDVPSDIIIGPSDTGSTHYSLLTLQLDLDARDNPYNPRSGYRTLIQSQISTEAFGSQENYISLSLQQGVYVPLASRFVWANNIRAVGMEPFGSTDVIPLSQRIFLGGRNSLRGFSRYAVGPRGFDGDIVGGDTALNASSELQYDMTENTMGLVFIDCGQAFLRHPGTFTGDTLQLEDLRVSPGFGFRYKTPIGPVSAEYGVALDRRNGERLGRFNFGIGGAF